MLNSAAKILIVDDDHASQNFICNSLADSYQLKTADGGQSGIDTALEWQPNLILLDVEMPGQNGFEVCDALKQHYLTKNIPVIFISGNSSVQEKIHGFEAGADDYLVKPCEKEIIKAKVDYIISLYKERKSLNRALNNAKKTAKTAIKSSEEIGGAMRFIESTYAMPTFDGLAKGIFQVMEELGLEASLLIMSSEKELYFTHDRSVISPMEKEILQMMHGRGRLSDFGCRTVFNFKEVSLLVKNMPLDDEEHYGRLKNTIPFVLGAANEKAHTLSLQNAILHQAENLTRSTGVVRETLQAIKHAFGTQEKISTTMRALMQDLDEKLPRMGLDDDQEKYIVDRVDLAFMESIKCLDEGAALKGSLAGVVRLLSHLTIQQGKIVENACTVIEKSKKESAINLQKSKTYTPANVTLF